MSKEKLSEFIFETSLYTTFVYDDIIIQEFFHGDIDGYDVFRKTETTFEVSYSEVDDHSYKKFNDFWKVSLKDKRTGNLYLWLFVLKTDTFTIEKVGQYPTVADIQLGKIPPDYKRFLSQDNLTNYKKAIGFYAHGGGAGSLVYLRRVFENLIFKTFQQRKDDLDISEDEFRLKRMDEKTDYLKDYLPEKLMEFKSIYGILSLGVHELPEEDCLAYFPALKLSIEIILDQAIEKRRKEKREHETKKKLQEIGQILRQRNKQNE